MSLQANPLLYLNMGGEMLYVVRQRLKAQRIAIDRSVRVLDEVGMALLDPLVVTRLFEESRPINMREIRSSLERAVLSSIMRLDESSMRKLFDLVTMMVKYQIEAVTGPRELLLVTFNHIDFVRDMIINSSGDESVAVLHRTLLRLYGNLTYEEIWQAREACADSLRCCNVRVSILLRLGLQKEDGTFRLPRSRKYDERYEERREDLANIKISDNSCEECNVGSLELIGDRVTLLGGNMYSPTKEKAVVTARSNSSSSGNDERGERSVDEGSKAELGMLAVQLGSEKNASSESPARNPRPFAFQFFPDNESVPKRGTTDTEDERSETRPDYPVDCPIEPISNDRYRARLDRIYAEFVVEAGPEETVSRKMELLELMDQLE